MNIYKLYRQYKQIQTAIFVHIACYIRAYFLFYLFIYVHIAYMCAYFLQGNPLVVQYRHVWACMHIYIKNMHIYAQIYTIYMQDTCKIQALQSCLEMFISKNWYYICMYKYVYGIYCIYTCMYFLGSSYMPVSVRMCIYLHVYACIWENTCIKIQTRLRLTGMHISMYLYVSACIIHICL